MQGVIGAVENLLKAEGPDGGGVEDDRIGHPLRVARGEAAVLENQANDGIANDDQAYAGGQSLE